MRTAFERINFWFDISANKKIRIWLELLLDSFVSCSASLSKMLIIPLIIGAFTSFSFSRIVFLIAASLLLLILSPLEEIIDSTLAQRGSHNLNYANKKIVVPALTRIKHDTLCKKDTFNLISKAQSLIRSGDSSEVSKLYRTIWHFLSSIISLIIVGRIIIKLNSFTLLILLMFFLFSFILRKKLNKKSIILKNEQISYETNLSYCEKICLGRKYAKEIRTYNWKDFVQNKNNNALHKKSRLKKKEIRASEYASFFSEMGKLFAVSFVLISTSLAANIDYSLEEIVFLFLSINTLWSSLDRLCTEYENIKKAENDIFVFLSLNQLGINNGTQNVIANNNCSKYIYFDSVSFSYDDSDWLFKDFNLTINKGDCVGLVGLNGSGKTTLIKLLIGLLEPQQGRIWIEGKLLNEVERRKYFAPVFQYIKLFPTTLEKIISAKTNPGTSDIELIKKEMAGLPVEKKIDSLSNGLKTLIGPHYLENAADLSGGESQWVLFIRALIKRAPILILDEANSALDYFGEEKMYNLFEKTGQCKTLIFVSHRLAFSTICSRVLFLENGKILEDGSPEELIRANGAYAMLYKEQSNTRRESE